MLALVSAAFFVVPAQTEVSAQANRFTSICINPSTGSLAKPAPDNACPSGSTLKGNLPLAAAGVCKFKPDGSSTWEILPPILENDKYQINTAGTKCINPEPYADFIRFSTITQYTPGGTNPTTPTTPTTPGTNPTTPSTNTPSTTTPSTQSSGGCEAGFRKLGVLCVPGSPVGSSNSLVSEQTAGGLAARIVTILLYFAGIVAVIMAIVGGYYVMTAAGNEAQATSGRKTLTNAIIGLVIVILSYIIIQAVVRFIT